MEQNKLLEVVIITPQKTVYSGTAVSATVPGTNGQFQVLINHAPIVSTLEKGIVRVDSGSGTQTFSVGSGMIEVHSNKVSVLVESADEISVN